MADHIRSESARRRRENEVALEAARMPEAMPFEAAPQEDDTLVLLFHVLPSCLDSVIGSRSDVTRGGRLDDSRN
jgi:hypothetical protein